MATLVLQEIAMRFKTSINNEEDTFYTDLNGFQLTRRRTRSKIPLQGNFYPMPTGALLQDNNNRLTLYSGQPLGVASLKKGACGGVGISVFLADMC
jgi:alpha-mannosidase II